MKVGSSICKNKTIKTELIVQYNDIDIYPWLLKKFISHVSCSLSACKDIQKTLYLYKACKRTLIIQYSMRYLKYENINHEFLG